MSILRRTNMRIVTKVCIKCPIPIPLPLDQFYKRVDSDKVSNICKACTIKDIAQRHREQKAGTFSNKLIITVEELTGIIKPCNDCGAPKDAAHFRAYITKVNGKAYEYRANRCRDCERINEQSRRDNKHLFNEADYKSIMDAY